MLTLRRDDHSKVDVVLPRDALQGKRPASSCA
jgi:hypothetical protein